MKKFVSVLLSMVSVICFAFAIVGCGKRSDKERAETDGILHTLINAFNAGWIDEYDLKIIACGYYEWQSIGENPYSGLYEEPAGQLSKETEDKIKLTYSDRSEDIKISKYYGMYDGNIVITLEHENLLYDGEEKTDMTVGSVVFPKLKLYPIFVYHYPEKADPSVTVTGRLYDIKSAYGSGLLDENDLKSIACCVNESDSSIENPYSGMYEPPARKLSKETKTELKQLYLEQIDGYFCDVLDGIAIHKYYGIYKGNIVVSMSGYSCGIPATPERTEIGGVAFNHYTWMSIYVYKI